MNSDWEIPAHLQVATCSWREYSHGISQQLKLERGRAVNQAFSRIRVKVVPLVCKKLRLAVTVLPTSGAATCTHTKMDV